MTNSAEGSIDALIKHYVETNKTTYQHLAIRTGVRPSSLRTWITRNKYPEEFIEKLAPLLSTTPDALRAQYPDSLARPKSVRQQLGQDIEMPNWGAEPNLRAALEYMEKKTARLHTEPFEPEVEVLFGNMSLGDVFIYHSSFELPFESTPTGGEQLWRVMTEAVKRGAYFAYLIPSPTLLNGLEKWKLDVKRHSTFTTAIQTIRDGLAAIDPSADVNGHILTFEFGEPLFSAPDHKFVLFKPAPPKAGLPTPPRLLALYPIGTRDNSKFLHLPLGRDVTNDFIIFLRQIGTHKGNKKLLTLLSHGRA